MSPTPSEERAVSLEREIFERQAELNELRRSLPRVAVENYPFETRDGERSLEDLFGRHDDLLVIHNMGQGCPYCTLWADGLNGVFDHLVSRTAVALCSPDTPDQQHEFARSRGWKFLGVRDRGSFTRDMGYSQEGDDGRILFMPGFTTFHRTRDRIERVASAAFGPGDVFAPIWHLFGALADGPGDWRPQFGYAARPNPSEGSS